MEKPRSQPLKEDASDAAPKSEPLVETTPEPTVEPAVIPLSTLADSLKRSRALAREAQESETGSRRKLYRALEAAYAFFLEAETDSDGYGQLLNDAGLTRQDRAPFTPVVKLVFGARFPKTQLSEYAATLSHARRLGCPASSLAGFIEAQEGGLKALVQAEREARRAERGSSAGDRRAAVLGLLRQADSLGEARLSHPVEEEFILLLGRRPSGTLSDRASDGRIELVAIERRATLLDTVLRLAAQERRRELTAERRRATRAAKEARRVGQPSETPELPAAAQPADPDTATDGAPAES